MSLNRECHSEPFPWQFAGLLRFDGQEVSGGLNNVNITVPTLRISWDDGAGGDLRDLMGPWHNGVPDSPNVTQDLIDYGIFVTATATTDVFSVGWYADVPPGQVIGANV